MTAGVAEHGASLRDRLDTATAHWFGYAAPPAERAMADAGFAAEARDAYCHRCGDSVGIGEVSETGCASCRDKTAMADGVVRLGPYLDELRDWVLRIKYERWTAMARTLGALLGDVIENAGVVDLERTVIVPMPMPWQRRLYRGIDHAQLIAVSAAHRLDVPLERVLAKKHGPPQVTLTPTDRQRLGGRNLRVRKRFGGWRFDGAHMIVIDDVRTTGTTVRRAVRLLRQFNPEKVVAAVLAVADAASRRARHAGSVSRNVNDDGQ